MRIFEINNFSYNQTNTFKAKKISKPAERFISEQQFRLLNATLASIGMAGIALGSNNEVTVKHRKKHRSTIDKIDKELFMQVYYSDGSIHEKSKRLGINHKTYRKIIDELGLEFIPAQYGKKPQYEIPINFEEVYCSNIPVEEKITILGLPNSSLLYHYAHKMGLKKRKNISEEEFKQVFYMNIPRDKKYEMLGISKSSYYKYAEIYGCMKEKTH